MQHVHTCNNPAAITIAVYTPTEVQWEPNTASFKLNSFKFPSPSSDTTPSYSRFISLPDKTNKESVRVIEKSICTVCLDAPMPRVSDDIYKSRVAAQMLHGGGSRFNSGNRWFDKTLQVRPAALKVPKRWLWRCFLRLHKSKKSQEPFTLSCQESG